MDKQLLLGDFVAEIDEVQSTLLAATTDLTSPLGDLVRAQIKRSQPPICGAVVLAVAISTPKPKPTTQPTTMYSESLQAEVELRRKRILLAAALEMLHVALNVHRLLVNAALREQQSNGKNALDPSFIGSTILAGDYCFSRAAQMAAQTDHPRVVALFSLALQTVSEGLLREQFRRGSEPTSAQNDAQDSSQFHTHDGNHSDLANLVTNEASVEDEYGSENGNKYGNGNYDETRQLLHSGAHAAALLIDLAESEQQQAIALSHELASHWALHKQRTGADEHQSLSHSLNNWGEALPGRWQALHHWLDYQHTISKASPISPKLPPKTSPEASPETSSKRCD